MTKPIVVAIDGRASSGKGTIARRLAPDLGFDHLDTGLLYRSVTLNLITEGVDHTDVAEAVKAAKLLDTQLFTPELLHSEEVSEKVAVVAAMPKVREVLRSFQKNFPKFPGAVIDGRDIGTVIFPDAPIKFFIDARVEVRAERAVDRLREAGRSADYDEVLFNISERDKKDAEREHSPMKPAEDAIIVDTSDLDKDRAYMHVLRLCAKKLALLASGDNA
jgi:cytidylate kinase